MISDGLQARIGQELPNKAIVTAVSVVQDTTDDLGFVVEVEYTRPEHHGEQYDCEIPGKVVLGALIADLLGVEDKTRVMPAREYRY